MTRNGLTRRDALTVAAALGLAPLAPRMAAARVVARLGDREVLSVSDGGFTLPLGMAASGRPVEEVRALLQAANMPTDRVDSVLNVTVLKDGDGYTIFDCGAGQNFLAGSGKLGENLAAAGIAPDKVKRVIFTHGHPDHLWGAVDDFDTPAFPEATYHFPEAERAYWHDPDIYKHLPEDRHAFAAGAQRILKLLEPKLAFFKPGAEVASGVLSLATPGHTPGHVSFELAAGSNRLIVLGDAITHPIISFRHPDWRNGSDADPALAAETRRRLLARLADEKIPVIGYHLPVPGLGQVERDGSAFLYRAA